MTAEQSNYPVSTVAKFTIFLVSIALIIYNIVRILCVPMTHDEIAIVSQLPSYSDIIHVRPVSANNHILNSLIRKFLMETFHHTTPFVIRLDNLLALILFLVSSYHILTRLIINKFWIIASFLFLVLNPFMFDFWGLSRGYGLSLAFMTTSILSFVAYQQSNKTSMLWFSQAWAILAVYSNFSTLNFYFALAGTCFLLPITQAGKSGIRTALRALPVVLLSAVLLALLIARPLIDLHTHNELYYGGDKNLISDTLHSLTENSLMVDHGDKLALMFDIMIVISILFSCIYWFKKILRKGEETKVYGIALILLFVIPLLSIYLQHLIFNVKYLIERTALFLIVLYKLQLLYTLYDISQKRHIVSDALLTILTCWACFNFTRHINTYKTRSWWYDANNLVVLDRIVNEHKGKPGKIKLRTFWLFAPSLSYYSDTRYKDLVFPVEYTQKDVTNDTSFDYYYIESSDTAVLTGSYVLDTSFYRGHFVLMKKN